MSDKQTLQSQITQLKNVLASPKTDGTTRKILESGLRKAEAKLDELEKAEKLESSKKELTPKQEEKVEEIKKETKSLAQTLKEKVKKAKEKIATTTPKATKKGGARSVAKAKEMAKERRSTQKKQSLSDKDIESDANRKAINKTKRKSQGGRANQYGTKAENKGGTYYEKRENRYDVQNKRYAKLESGGSTDGKNGYVAFYKGKRIEVMADTMYQAQKKAAEIFKAKKSYEVNVALAEVNGKQYVHNSYAKGGELVPYIIWVSKGDDKRELYGEYKSQRAAEMAMKKLWDNSDYVEMGNKPKSKYEKEGLYADGGAIQSINGTQFSTEDLSGMFAKGGIMEHGLEIGDMIIGMSDDPYSIIVRNNGMEMVVDLNEGTRVSNNQGTRFSSRSMKDPMVVRTQFEEMDFEYADGGMMASGGRITKGAKYMSKFTTSKGDSGYSILEIVDTDFFSLKYNGSPHTIRVKVLESSIPQEVGKYDEYSRKEIQTLLKYGMWTKLNHYADGGSIQTVNGTEFSTEDLSGMFANGGKIKNQYEGRTPEDIWNNLSKEQRSHFLYDHAEEIEEYRGEEYGELSSREIMKAYNSNYNELEKNRKNRCDNHTREGQYKMGGEIKVEEGDMIKSKTIKGKVYQSMGSMFKIEDEFGNKNPKFYSTKDFKKSEIIKMANGGVTNSMEDVNYLKSMSGLRASYLEEWANKNNVDLSKVANAIKTKKLKPMDLSTGVSGRDGNKYAKDIIQKYSHNKMGMGGTTFDDKVSSISKSLMKRKKVAPSVQKDYGKSYSKDEAIDSAKRIAGAMRKKEMMKKKS